MIGRLIEKQEVGLPHQLAGERKPFPPTTGEGAGFLIEIREAGLSQCDGCQGVPFVLFVLLIAESIHHHFPDREARGKGIVLGQVAQLGAPLKGAVALVRVLHAHEDFEQSRFARTIGADEAESIFFAQLQREIGKERPMTKALAHLLNAE